MEKLYQPPEKKKTANTIQVYQVPKSLYLKCHLIIFDPFQTEKHEIPSKSHKGKPLNPLNIPWKPFKISWKTHENHLDPHQNHEKKVKHHINIINSHDLPICLLFFSRRAGPAPPPMRPLSISSERWPVTGTDGDRWDHDWDWEVFMGSSLWLVIYLYFIFISNQVIK